MKTAIFILVLILLVGCSSVGERTFPQADPSLPVLTIEQVTALSYSEFLEQYSSSFNVEGYISFMTECPKCPKGAMCASCQFPMININSVPNSTSTHETTLSIITYQQNGSNHVNNQFQLGKRYLFSVELLNPERNLNSSSDIMVSLIGYDFLE